MKERHLYRVETVNMETCESICGFVYTVTDLFEEYCGVKDAHDMFLLQQKLGKNSLGRMLLMSFYKTLDGITIPEIYKNDIDNYVCLYTKTGFNARYIDLCVMAEAYHRINPGEDIMYKEFVIPNNEIVFKEKNQVVITWETYEKYRNQNRHNRLDSVTFDFDFDKSIPKQTAQSPAG